MNVSLAEPLSQHRLEKAPTGIDGLDDVLDGGLPRGRPILVCGTAGCGKTLFGLQFLARGALEYGEPGAFIAFEERPEDLAANVASLGLDLPEMQRNNLLSVDYIRVDPQEIVESGSYDLEGLFLRLGLAIDSVGAKRVVIDTLEMLFGGLKDYGILRAELRRLFEWLKERGVTAIITAERGDGTLTRHGLEEYVSDCVILLDHRVHEQVSTRRLRVVKYRGSTHGTNEYPFLIDRDGISVLPITSAGLAHDVSSERISSGVPRLDTMLGGEGFYRGSTVLVSGTAGLGKTTLASHFVDAACQRGERALYVASEESPAQIVRNARSVSIPLDRHERDGKLRFLASRPSAFGIETHLAVIHRAIERHEPRVVVLDPISTFVDAGTRADAHSMLVRLVDFLKSRQITAMLTSLTSGGQAIESTEAAISSIVDSWLLLRAMESNGERNRGLYVLKSRGMAHSNQVREFVITDRGVDLLDVYVGSEGVLTGTARLAQLARDRDEALSRERERERAQLQLTRRRALHQETLARLEAELAADVADLERKLSEQERAARTEAADRQEMARARFADETRREREGSAS